MMRIEEEEEDNFRDAREDASTIPRRWFNFRSRPFLANSGTLEMRLKKPRELLSILVVV